MTPQPLRRAVLISSAAVLVGCSLRHNDDHNGPNSPRFAPLTRVPANALVLGSGGPRGFVHIGVLKALDQLKLRPALVVGSSVGALIGSLYASGMSAAELETLAMDLQPTALARMAIGAKEPLSSTAIYAVVKEVCKVELIERTPIALGVIAYNRDTGKTEVLTKGDIAVAVQASSAIEGTFTPVKINGQIYHDADLHMPLPVRAAQQLGAQAIVAIDASAHEDKAPASAARFRVTDQRKRELTAPDTKLATLNLHPDFGYYVSASAEFRARAIEAGYRAALSKADQLRSIFTAIP